MTKSGRLELGDNILRTFFNPCDVIGQQKNYEIWLKEHKIRAIMLFKVGINRKPLWDFLRTVSELLQLIVQILDTLCF